MEEALIRLCAVFGVRAGRIAGLTGVWCGVKPDGADSEALEPPENGPERKIGAIGIHVSRGITSHGFAFNITTDLRDFSLINPCGITDRPVTSLEREIARPAELQNLEAIAHQAARQFGVVFDQHVLAVENLDALRAQAALVPPATVFPAEDTPLQVPAEVERLKHGPEPSFRA
jgi:lipoyl(octanoyl) transferase